MKKATREGKHLVEGESLAHGKDHYAHHARWSRRNFLSTLGMSGGVSMLVGGVPIKAAAISPLGYGLLNGDEERVLVLVQLKGGNDGLNTLIPLYDYDFYRNARPKIGIPETNILQLNDDFGLQSGMQDLLPLWDSGAMKIIQNVGYPNPNLSHFRGTDIWSAASDDDELLKSGWLGRWLDEEYPDFANEPPTVPPAIQIGSYGSLVFNNGMFNLSVSVTNPEELAEIAQNGELYNTTSLPNTCYGEELRFVRTISNSTFAFAESIKKAFDASTTDAEYENTFQNNLGEQLELVARLIKGNLGSKIFMVSISGFDTHANQNETHQGLWQGISKTIKAFYDDLAADKREDDVLTMTFSEFGRRIEENASLGTDHGTAAPMFLFGPGLGANGFVGEKSDLRAPDQNGNLIFSTDFRSVYATVLEHWLCVDSVLVNQSLGNFYPRLSSLVTACGLSTSNDQAIPGIQELMHKAIYNDNGDIWIQYRLPEAGDITLEIYSIQGTHITSLHDGYRIAGQHSALFSPSLYSLSSGHYLYRLQYKGQIFSQTISVVN